MLQIAVKILNYAGYLYGCNVLGSWFTRFYYGLFGFIKDEQYAADHPKMYIAKVVAVMVIGILLALAIIWYPLTKLMEWIDDKIDEFFKKKEEKEEDEDLEWLD